MEQQSKKKKPRLSQTNKYIRFSSVGIQMGVIIAAGVFLGDWLDTKYQSAPLWTVICSLGAVFSALYQVYKEVMQMDKEENDSSKP